MIQVVKSRVPVPTQLTSQNCISSLNRVWNNGTPNTGSISKAYYRHHTVLTALSGLYHNKCAYCESYDNEFEVEHYRPKASVLGETHPGYYWLAYEWTNLLPACHDCNKVGSKGYLFPIIGTRMMAPVIVNPPPPPTIDRTQNNFQSAPLLAERALLIHPEEPDFNPFHYFRFDNTGQMLAKRQPRRNRFDYQRANKTIEILRLNRDKLYLMGKKTFLLDLKRTLTSLLFKLLNPHRGITQVAFREFYFEELQKIKRRSLPTHPFSFFWSFLYENILTYIYAHVRQNANTRQLFEDLTDEFKTANP